MLQIYNRVSNRFAHRVYNSPCGRRAIENSMENLLKTPIENPPHCGLCYREKVDLFDEDRERGELELVHTVAPVIADQTCVG